MLRWAHTILEVKSVDDDQRIIEGFASTPEPDTIGDIMDPMGAVFSLPLKFLYQHDRERVLGKVLTIKRSKDGLWIKAQIEKDVPAALAYVDQAWEQIKRRMVDGLSIGWRPLAEPKVVGEKALWSKWKLFEVSAVSFPMNETATIALVKSLDASALAALGTRASASRSLPGASGSRITSTHMKNLSDRITALQTERTETHARMTEIMQPVLDDETHELGADESAEYDTLKKSLGSIDERLERLVALQKESPAVLKPVNGETREKAAESRSHDTPRIEMLKKELPKGTAMTRYAMALGMSKGNIMQAVEIAKQWRDSTPEVEFILKTAVAAGTTTDATWAGNLAQYNTMSGEFVELLRPLTLLGRIPGLRVIPPNVSVPAQTAGGTYGWVGQGAPKPVGALATTLIQLRWAKAAGIIVLSEELVRFSNPSAEGIVRNDMLKGMARFLDAQFVTPGISAVANVSPASITNGAPNSAAAGTSFANFIADVKEALTSMESSDISPDGVVILMRSSQAIALSLMRNSLGVFEAPGLSASGGTVLGLPVVASETVPSGVVIYVKPQEIFFTDDGVVTIDVSREASVQMDDAPSEGAQQLVSFWQNNLVGLRAERFINWERRLTNAVYYHTSANYGG